MTTICKHCKEAVEQGHDCASDRYYEALVRIDEIASQQFNNVIANIAREALGDAYIERMLTGGEENG
jgi:hypothetical protein